MSARSLAIASHIFALFVGTDAAPDIKSVKTDLKLPALQTGEANAGKGLSRHTRTGTPQTFIIFCTCLTIGKGVRATQ